MLGLERAAVQLIDDPHPGTDKYLRLPSSSLPIPRNFDSAGRLLGTATRDDETKGLRAVDNAIVSSSRSSRQNVP